MKKAILLALMVTSLLCTSCKTISKLKHKERSSSSIDSSIVDKSITASRDTTAEVYTDKSVTRTTSTIEADTIIKGDTTHHVTPFRPEKPVKVGNTTIYPDGIAVQVTEPQLVRFKHTVSSETMLDIKNTFNSAHANVTKTDIEAEVKKKSAQMNSERTVMKKPDVTANLWIALIAIIVLIVAIIYLRQYIERKHNWPS